MAIIPRRTTRRTTSSAFASAGWNAYAVGAVNTHATRGSTSSFIDSVNGVIAGSYGADGELGASWTPQVSSELVAVLLYVWTLVAPLLFPDREFSGFGKSRA